ncbi:MAG TPA: septal ring lytic transglycosylase RlpA family protein [Polyangiaceae bacterium]|nr:septal ring lytic transglycosylase RlpA family protein [Polyangiaceae bacterium]
MAPSLRPFSCLLWLALGLAACADEPGAGALPPPQTPADVQTHTLPLEPAQADGCTPGELRQQPLQVLKGKATYYANSLRGSRTSTGERYDPRKLTAAHRSLPFGTRVRVTRTDLKSSPVVCVVINDRGPFGHKSYILDLSRRGADWLKMVRRGVVPVKVEVLTIGKR